MGAYVQIGICHRLVVDKESMLKLKVSLDKLIHELNQEMDMSLYDVEETESKIVFKLRESVVVEQ